MNKLFWIIWPSFLVAGIAEIMFFAIIQPRDLYFFGQPVDFSPLATYSIGFFCFWAICAASSLATCFFQRSGDQINHPDGSRASVCS
jgi:hypothetical protein